MILSWYLGHLHNEIAFLNAESGYLFCQFWNFLLVFVQFLWVFRKGSKKWFFLYGIFSDNTFIFLFLLRGVYFDGLDHTFIVVLHIRSWWFRFFFKESIFICIITTLLSFGVAAKIIFIVGGGKRSLLVWFYPLFRSFVIEVVAKEIIFSFLIVNVFGIIHFTILKGIGWSSTTGW